MSRLPARITVGELSARSGIAASALRFYEAKGLICAERPSGNQRRYPRHALRRVAFIRAAQRVGLSLEEIAAALRDLPEGRNTQQGRLDLRLPRLDDPHRPADLGPGAAEGQADRMRRLRVPVVAHLRPEQPRRRAGSLAPGPAWLSTAENDGHPRAT